MFVPDVFRRNVFDDLFDFPDFPFDNVERRMPANVMKTDVKETESGYELSVELPGVKKEDIQAHLSDGYLTVTAVTSHSNDEKDKKGNYIRRERYSGSYSRSYYVGEEIKDDDIKAKFDNGILTLDIPKPQEKPKIEEKKKIAIE